MFHLFSKKGLGPIQSLNGEGGIRTHAPLRTNGFQDRLVMTTSIPLHVRSFSETFDTYHTLYTRKCKVFLFLFLRIKRIYSKIKSFGIFSKLLKRRGWDSNPRALADKRFSRPPRYDHFDTSPLVCFDKLLSSCLNDKIHDNIVIYVCQPFFQTFLIPFE